MHRIRPALSFLLAASTTFFVGWMVRSAAIDTPPLANSFERRARPATSRPRPELLRVASEARLLVEAEHWTPLDLRPSAAYLAGHLPGAIRWSPPSTTAATAVETVQQQLAALGLSGRESVLIYGEAENRQLAGHTFWWLERVGMERVAVLDGEVEDWQSTGGTLSRDEAPRAATTWVSPSRDEMVVSIAELSQSFGLTGVEILDLRDEGTWMANNYQAPPRWSAGHIPYALPYDFRTWVTAGWPALAACQANLESLGPRHETRIDLAADLMLYGEDGADPQLGLAYLLLRRMGLSARVVPEGFRGWRAAGLNPVVRIVEPAEVAALLLRASSSPQPQPPILIDLREERDFRERHIPTAWNLPWFELPRLIEPTLERERPNLDRQKSLLIFYCYGRDCIRSREASNLAAHSGFLDIGWLREGMDGWPEKLVPLVVGRQENQAVDELRGQVVDPLGQPVAGAEVTFRPRIAGDTSEFDRQIQSDAEGRFVLTGLEPGLGDLAVAASGYRNFALSDLEIGAGDVEDLRIELVRGGSLVGRVLRANGLRAAEALVSASFADGRGERLAVATADRRGRYQMDGLPAENLRIEASLGSGGRAMATIDLSSSDGELDLTLPAGLAVRGRVEDQSGEAIAGVRLLLTSASDGLEGGPVMSGSDGAFIFRDLAAGTYSLLATKPGYFPQEEAWVELRNREVEHVVVRLATGLSLTGRLLGLPATDLGSVEVLAHGQPDSRRGSVEPGGIYRVEGLAPGSWRVKARLAGTGRQAEALIQIGADNLEPYLDLDFSAGLILSGQVEIQGAAVADALVTVFSPTLGLANHTRTDAEGSFRLENLQPSSYELQVFASSERLRHRQLVVLESDYDLRLDLGGTSVSGRVLSAESSGPLDRASLRLESLLPQEEFFPAALPRLATADSRGRFRFDQLPAGPYRLLASAPGHAAASLDLDISATGPAEELDLRLSPNEGLSFSVVLPSGAVPRAVTVALLRADGATLEHGVFTPEEDGQLTLSSVPAGAWRLVLAAEATATLSLNVQAPAELGRLTLPPAGSLRLRVPELEGEGIAASAELFGQDGQRLTRLEGGAGPSSSVLLEHGSARLDSIPAGSWTVWVAAADGRQWRAPVQVVAGAETSLSVR